MIEEEEENKETISPRAQTVCMFLIFAPTALILSVIGLVAYLSAFYPEYKKQIELKQGNTAQTVGNTAQTVGNANIRASTDAAITNQEQLQSLTFKTGQEVRLLKGGIIARSPEAFKQFLKSAQDKDDTGIKDLVATGKLTIVNGTTEASALTDSKLFDQPPLVKIRVKSGSWNGTEGWAHINDLQHTH